MHSHAEGQQRSMCVFLFVVGDFAFACHSLVDDADDGCITRRRICFSRVNNGCAVLLVAGHRAHETTHSYLSSARLLSSDCVRFDVGSVSLLQICQTRRRVVSSVDSFMPYERTVIAGLEDNCIVRARS